MARDRKTSTRDKNAAKVAFTLVEMLVVTTIIVLAVSMVLPSVTRLFGAGAESQAYNVLSAQLTAARAQAIMNGTYAAMHAQMADKAGLQNSCYAAVMLYDPNDGGKFKLAPGFSPRKIPGNYAFGKISDDFVDTDGTYMHVGNDAEIRDFTSVTVVFNASGAVVKHINGDPVSFDATDPIFAAGDGQLWETPPNELGVLAVALFSYPALLSAPDREDYLETYCRFIPVNVYTGQLLER